MVGVAPWLQLHFPTGPNVAMSQPMTPPLHLVCMRPPYGIRMKLSIDYSRKRLRFA